jgi:ketosteroid isomerase-like protein
VKTTTGDRMPNDAAREEIKALEDKRYRAMIAGDVAVLDDLCSDDLIYTHSKADYDDKQSYLRKVGTRYFTYLEITHPADRILVVNGAALVTGRMTAKVLVAGTIVQVDNRYLAVWVREPDAWKFVAYQPTPIINR